MLLLTSIYPFFVFMILSQFSRVALLCFAFPGSRSINGTGSSPNYSTSEEGTKQRCEEWLTRRINGQCLSGNWNMRYSCLGSKKEKTCTENFSSDITQGNSLNSTIFVGGDSGSGQILLMVQQPRDTSHGKPTIKKCLCNYTSK